MIKDGADSEDIICVVLLYKKITLPSGGIFLPELEVEWKICSGFPLK